MTTDAKILLKKKIIRADFDSPWKHSFQLYFRDFMEFCLPHIAEQIDWSKGYESLDKELNAITRDAKIRNRIADKLIKVWKKDGKETLILCHLEVDGNPKNKLPKRMMIYRYRIYDLRYLPIISIAILIDDDPNWRIDFYREECFGTYQEIRYIIVKLLDYQCRRQELEAMNNRFAIIVLAQLAVLGTKNNPRARLNAKTALTRLLYKKGYIKQDIIQLFILIDWLVTLPEELEVEYNNVVIEIEEENEVELTDFVTTPERVGMRKGIKQGESAMLMRQLQHRFQHIPSKCLELIEQADAETLLIWAERILDATSLEEVFL